MSVGLQILVVVLAVAVAAGGGWVAVTGVLRLASRSQDAGGDADDGPESDRARATLRGGTWIGILERLAVVLCILMDEPGGIAVVVAIKGLGRFPELRENPGASERFVIGTLASLVWAAAIAVAARALLA